MSAAIHGWEELDRLASLMEAEIEGRPVDRHEAQHLAETLAFRHPEIAGSLGRIRERMAGRL